MRYIAAAQQTAGAGRCKPCDRIRVIDAPVRQVPAAAAHRPITEDMT